MFSTVPIIFFSLKNINKLEDLVNLDLFLFVLFSLVFWVYPMHLCLCLKMPVCFDTGTSQRCMAT